MATHGLSGLVAHPVARRHDLDRGSGRVPGTSRDRQHLPAGRDADDDPVARLVVVVAGVADRHPLPERRQRAVEQRRDRRERLKACNEGHGQQGGAVDRHDDVSGRSRLVPVCRHHGDDDLRGQVGVLGLRGPVHGEQTDQHGREHEDGARPEPSRSPCAVDPQIVVHHNRPRMSFTSPVLRGRVRAGEGPRIAEDASPIGAYTRRSGSGEFSATPGISCTIGSWRVQCVAVGGLKATGYRSNERGGHPPVQRSPDSR